MKIILEIDDKFLEDEVIIRCRKLDSTTKRLEQVISEIASSAKKLTLYKENAEYYISLDNILFFETLDGSICAHTLDNVYTTAYKLYELEQTLPKCFVRVSKSTILNVNHVSSIIRNLTASSVVQFSNSHKQVYCSRNYYKTLKQLLDMHH